ncbi:MAG: hypothetical protein QXJ64_10010 [Thermosphaera sp.]
MSSLYRDKKYGKVLIISVCLILAGIIIGLIHNIGAGVSFIFLGLITLINRKAVRKAVGIILFILASIIIYSWVISIPGMELNIYNVLRSIALLVLAIISIIFGLFLLDP